MFNFGPKVPEISAESVKNALDHNEDCIILDVRTTDEVSRGKISKSINLPIDEIENKIETIIPDKKKTIYVYCLSGSRSSVAVQLMVQKGYKNVFSMTSGMLGWRAKQFPVEN